MPNTNWTAAAGAREANHSMHFLYLTTPGDIPPKMLDEIKFRLANFVDFNGGANYVANVSINYSSQRRYAWFDMRGLPGIPSWLLNGNPVPVQTWCDSTGTVYGDTADRHMLIGQRQWSVKETGPNALVVFTEAYERPRGILNRLGMRRVGKEAQMAVWHAYLSNMNTELTRLFSSFGTMPHPSIESKPVNPWKPTSSYPHLGGCP